MMNVHDIIKHCITIIYNRHSASKMHSLMTMIIFLFVCIFLITINETVGQETEGNAKVPAELLANALNFVMNSELVDADDNVDVETIIQSLRNGDVHTLHEVAKAMQSSGDAANSIPIYHALADGEASHIPSMISLGFTYANAISSLEKDANANADADAAEANNADIDKFRSEAIKYFTQAGEEGQHQASLYNAGRLFIQGNELAPGMAYIQAAVRVGVNFQSESERGGPGGAISEQQKREQDQQTAKFADAYLDLSSMMLNANADGQLGMQDVIDIFPYGNINGFPEEGGKEDQLWDEAMEHMQAFFDGMNSGDTSTTDTGTDGTNYLQLARKNLSMLQVSDGLSELQRGLISRIMEETLALMKHDEL